MSTKSLLFIAHFIRFFHSIPNLTLSNYSTIWAEIRPARTAATNAA